MHVSMYAYEMHMLWDILTIYFSKKPEEGIKLMIYFINIHFPSISLKLV